MVSHTSQCHASLSFLTRHCQVLPCSANETGAFPGMNHFLATNKSLHNEMQEWSSGWLSKEKEVARDYNG